MIAMETVLRDIEDRAERLHAHPLFEWVDSDDVPPETKLTLLPCLVNFTMGFRDLNKWVLRYPHPRNDLECGIDAHTFEDQTHSRLFLEDWERLGIDDSLGWRASETLWWLFLADDNEVSRSHGSYLRSIAVADEGDPLLRFAHSEVIEACGSVFFRHISPVAEALTDRTGIDLRYLGPYHLARESGHMECEELFEAQRLDNRQWERAVKLVDAMFRLFEEFFDSVLRYARRYVVAGTVPRPLADAHGSRNGHRALTRTPAGASLPRATVAIHPSQAPLQRLLEERRELVAQHAFYTWVRTANCRHCRRYAGLFLCGRWRSWAIGTSSDTQFPTTPPPTNFSGQ